MKKDKMKLWLLGSLNKKTGKRLSYDCAYGFVVRAHSAVSARRLAGKRRGDEKEKFWLDPTLSSCSLLKPDGEEGVVLQDFRAG